MQASIPLSISSKLTKTRWRFWQSEVMSHEMWTEYWEEPAILKRAQIIQQEVLSWSDDIKENEHMALCTVSG